MTNNHVVEHAESITVTLKDGRRFGARVVGTDPLTDVALLKIEGDADDLPTVSFADSSRLRVGDAVIAIGNPFGLGGTVTAGIISALGRDINAGPYDSFIQTDAAINRGNSGGPLFNTEGRIVGMNTAIFSPSGGSVGIGFAIPADTVKKVVAQLRDHGSVTRGWLGVQIQVVTPEIAEALGLDEARGALVAEVQPASPAKAAGLEPGDVILEVNGEKIGEMKELPALIAGIEPGRKAELVVMRDGRERRLDVTIGTLSPEKLAASAKVQGKAAPSALGIEVEPLTPESARRFGFAEDQGGVVVSSVDPEGPNADKLRVGDVIEMAGEREVKSPADLAAAIREAKADGKSALLLRVNRQGTPLFVGAKLPGKDLSN